MRVRYGVGAPLLVSLLLILGVAQPAAGAFRHTVTLGGNMTLLDDENWPWSDEHRTYSISRSAVLTHTRPRGSISVSHCVGGEVVGRLFIDLELVAGQRVRVSPTLYLYEGSSCGTTDLDGTRHGTPRNLSVNQRGAWTLKATNSEFTADDYAEVNFTVNHSA